MNRALLQKEFRQNGVWFLILGGISSILFFLIVKGFSADGTGGGVFYGIGQGYRFLIPVISLVLCHLVVAVEFRHKSQLFLEGLPLPRWRMVTIKALLVIALSCAYACIAVLLGWFWAKGTEAVDSQYLKILLSTASLWACFVASVFFLIAFLGRYRIPLLIVLLLALNWIVSFSSIPVGDFPPFALVERFGFERESYPTHNMIWTGVITLLFFGLAFAIGLIKEGSVAALLGEKMSYREKLFIGATIFSVFMGLASIDTPEAEPFALPGAIHESYEGIDVFISPEELNRNADLEISLAAYLAREFSKNWEWLGIPPDQFPPVYIVEKTDTEEELVEFEDVANDRVVLSYADYRHEDFHRETLMAWCMSHALEVHSFGRAGHEDRWWIVCGLEGLWELRDAKKERVKAREQLAAETVDVYGISAEQLLGRWKYAKEAGWKEANAVAYMGFRMLEESLGLETVQRLARKSVTKRFTRKDGRAVWWDLTHPVPSAFTKATGMTLEEFAAKLSNYIEEHKPDKETGEGSE